MKVFRVINDYINNHISRKSAEWDDIANIPDIVDSLTYDKYDINNPLTDEFWRDKLEIDSYTPSVKPDKYNNITDMYKKI